MNQREHRQSAIFSLWSSQFFFFTGLSALMFSLPTIAIVKLNLASQSIGMLYAATMLPFILLSIPAGHFIDVADPRKILMMVFLGSLCFEIWLTIQISIASFHVALIYLISILSSVVLLVSRLCYFSIVRRIFTEKDRLAANSRLIGNEQIAQILGTASMGIALNSLSTTAALSFSIILILVSFIFFLKIPRLIYPIFKVREYSKKAFLENIYQFLKIDDIRDLTIFFFFCNIFYGMLVAVYFFFAITDRSLSILQVSFIAGIGSLGNLFASPLIRRIFSVRRSPRHSVRLVFLLTVVGAFFLFGVFIPSPHTSVTVVLFACAFFLFYLTNNLCAALAVYVRQELAPRNLALLLGIGTTSNYSALALGSLAGGLAGKYAGASAAMVMAIFGMLLVGMIAYGMSGQLDIFRKKTS